MVIENRLGEPQTDESGLGPGEPQTDESELGPGEPKEDELNELIHCHQLLSVKRHQIPPLSIKCFTDSQVALYWIL